VHQLIIFASGRGTNATSIVEHFRNREIAKVALIVTNRGDAGVLELARKENIPFLVINKESFQSEVLIKELADYNPSMIVLAGFLWKIPDGFINAFRSKIINLHPALLPDHGGKGMFGEHVHKAVLSSGKTESGITIHYVDEHYDNGDIILQARCPVVADDSPASLSERVYELEHFFLPRTIEFLLKKA